MMKLWRVRIKNQYIKSRVQRWYSTALEAAHKTFMASSFKYKIISYYSFDSKNELAKLCDRYGSDKGEAQDFGHPYDWPSHTYTDYYSRLFRHCRNSVKKVFECGLGTNNPDIPSSMGVRGRPGASLRVWRDYFPNASVWGADIDKESLFQEERIQTHYLNQLDTASIKEFWGKVGARDFDFMVDDGLHTFEAGSNLFLNSVDRLGPSGIYVIEDVSIGDMRRYQEFFEDTIFSVDYVTLSRPKTNLGDNGLVVIRK